MLKPASICVCLLSLLTGCAEPKTITVTVYEQVYLPDRFLVDCPVPEAPQNLTYRELGALAAKRKSSVIGCNSQLRAAREYQEKIRAEADRK